MSAARTMAGMQSAAVLAAVAVAAFLAWKLTQAGRQAVQVGAGVITGNNALTAGATNASGAPVTAYQGAGIVGTVGAATNAASGGVLASLGEWLGAKTYDILNPSTEQTTTPLRRPAETGGSGGGAPSGWDYSGAALSFEQASAPDGWWPYGVQP